MNTIDKIVLFGSSGMLGNYIQSYFAEKIEIIPIKYKIINQNSFELLERLLLDHNIDERTCVINCIGLIPQRKQPNQTDKDYFIINSLFPNILGEICKKYNAKMIQPSTDCVFSGRKGNYVETDIHDETNAYGMSKSLGEPCGCTIIRTSIIGKEQANKKSLLEWILSNRNNQINGYTNHVWNGITCLEYCKVIEKIIQENIFWKGVKHIYSPTPKSKYELVKMVNVIFDLKMEIIPIETSEISNKTLFSIYENSFEIPELYDQMQELSLFALK